MMDTFKEILSKGAIFNFLLSQSTQGLFERHTIEAITKDTFCFTVTK